MEVSLLLRLSFLVMMCFECLVTVDIYDDLLDLDHGPMVRPPHFVSKWVMSTVDYYSNVPMSTTESWPQGGRPGWPQSEPPGSPQDGSLGWSQGGHEGGTEVVTFTYPSQNKEETTEKSLDATENENTSTENLPNTEPTNGSGVLETATTGDEFTNENSESKFTTEKTVAESDETHKDDEITKTPPEVTTAQDIDDNHRPSISRPHPFPSGVHSEPSTNSSTTSSTTPTTITTTTSKSNSKNNTTTEKADPSIQPDVTNEPSATEFSVSTVRRLSADRKLDRFYLAQNKGKGSFHPVNHQVSQCNLGSIRSGFSRRMIPDDAHLTAVLSSNLFLESYTCGMCIRVHMASYVRFPGRVSVPNPFTAVVKSECTNCDKGTIVFPVLGSTELNITYQAVPCPDNDDTFVKFRFVDSNRVFLKVQAWNFRYPITRMMLRHARHYTRDWLKMVHTSDGFFVYKGAPIAAPFQILVVSFNDFTILETFDSIVNDVVLETTKQFAMDRRHITTTTTTTTTTPIPITATKVFRFDPKWMRGGPGSLGGPRGPGASGGRGLFPILTTEGYDSSTAKDTTDALEFYIENDMLYDGGDKIENDWDELNDVGDFEKGNTEEELEKEASDTASGGLNEIGEKPNSGIIASLSHINWLLSVFGPWILNN